MGWVQGIRRWAGRKPAYEEEDTEVTGEEKEPYTPPQPEQPDELLSAKKKKKGYTGYYKGLENKSEKRQMDILDEEE